MREISRNAGITQAAIYHHFTNKEALYIAAVEYLYEGQTAELVSMASQQQDPLAVAVIGGVVSSALLTLLVVPVAYSLMDRWLVRHPPVLGQVG